jgi:glycosyltransferase involved in cell wall biosynthesis
MRVLTLFLTGGKSLRFWREEGTFSREILVYRRLLETGAFDRVQVFSYDAADRRFLAELAREDALYERFDVLAPVSGRGGSAWGVTGVWGHRAAIARSAALKTNQVRGSLPAILAARMTGVPLVFRMGYRLSRRLELNGERAKAAAARALERAGARIAARIVVTSENIAADFRSDPAVAAKVRLLPTYVDTSTFAPAGEPDRQAPVIAVGRFTPQKNLPALLKGCAIAGVGVTLVGKGPGEAELRTLAAGLPVAVRFAGTVDNDALPALLGSHGLFVLPSLHEGLPKVLIEAMAAGMTCVASGIPGVTDLIEDGVTGYLIRGFAPEDIAAAIRRAREASDPAIGLAARVRIEERFGLERYVAAEAAVYREIA